MGFSRLNALSWISGALLSGTVLTMAFIQVRLEFRLSHLQRFCGGVRVGVGVEDAMAAAGREQLTRVTTVHASNTDNTSVVLAAEGVAGWSCELLVQRGRVTQRSFGADHGAARSL